MFQRPTPPDITTEYLVIGAGVAGITIAQKLKESGAEVWLLGSAYESQLAKAGPLQNVTTIPEGTIGLDHIENMLEKAKSVGINHKTSLCTGIMIDDEIIVKTKHQKFIPKKVIIATGAKQARLNFEGEENYFHRGISDCAVCDWGLFRGKNVAVIGDHEYTRRATEFLKQHAAQVCLLWLSKDIDFKIDDVPIYTNVNDISAKGSDVLESINFTSDQGQQTLQISGLFVEGGPIPATKFLDGSPIELDDNGYVIIDDRFQTNIPNIWAIGDVTGITNSYESALDHANQLIELM